MGEGDKEVQMSSGTIKDCTYEVQSVGIQSIIMSLLCMVTDDNQTQCGDDFEMHRNVENAMSCNQN